MQATVESGRGVLLAMLEARAREAESVAELGFSIANDSYGLVEFHQALVFRGDGAGATVQTVSGLAQLKEDSPYLIWLGRAWPWLQGRVEDGEGWFALPGDGAGVPPEVLEGWREWWSAGIVALPLRRRAGEVLGWVCFVLDAPLQDGQLDALRQVAQTWAYCWEMLAGKPRPDWRARWRQLNTRQRRLIGVGLLLLLLFPVRQSALAPAEVVALDAEAVAAPLDGVVKAIHVRPNQAVKAGEPLFSLDDTTLRNRLQVAQKSVAVADAELLAATQKAFDNFQSKGELALLGGRAHEKRAELQAIQAQLTRIDVTAAQDGVVVFGDPDDWLGRPVATGERIMLLANPEKPGVLVYLPVADAIALDEGAALKLFLTVRPLSPLTGMVTETSYQAILSPDGVASYRLRGRFESAQAEARIGLRGTAKVFGGWVCLGYYILRRPLAFLRERSGW